MLRRVPPFEECGGAMGFSPWSSTFGSSPIQLLKKDSRVRGWKVEGVMWFSLLSTLYFPLSDL
jgi:hypothetical protein